MKKGYNLRFSFSSSFRYLAKYYRREKKYDLMKKYLFLVIEKGCSYGMQQLGCYYRDVEKNYDLAIKYLNQSAIDDYKPYAFWHDLGCTYKDMKDYDNMKINFEKAIVENKLKSYGHGSADSLLAFALYYRDIEKNYKLMKKYLDEATKYDQGYGGDIACLCLINFYNREQDEIDIDEYKRYCVLSIGYENFKFSNI